MKNLKPLKFEELSAKQKLGLVHTPLLGKYSPEGTLEYLLEQIKDHALGSVWIQWDPSIADDLKGYIKAIREAADYPIMIITDLESGIGDYKVGQHNSVGCTDSEAHAYAFGKATAVTAHALGYNMVCNPVMDLKFDGWQRGLGSDKKKIAKLAAAEARGLHDGGLLTIGKHYPSGANPGGIDSHMQEGLCLQTKEELLDTGLYAYRELIKEGLLDGVMPGHHKFREIDDTAPASMSKKVLSIIYDEGFDGIMMTDALCMMGIRAKYGRVECTGLAIEAGNTFALIYDDDAKFNQNALYECYEKGILSDEALDRAVRRVLALQEKIKKIEDPKYTTLTEEEDRLAKSINKDAIWAVVDEGVSLALPKDGKYYFALMVRNESLTGIQDGVQVDTFSNGWHYPTKITNKIKETFPNSHVEPFFQFPTQGQNGRILSRSLDYDQVIFITFSESLAYCGKEHLTRRVETLISAMQYTDRISTVIHYGNPTVLENIPHIPRIIFGGVSTAATLGCIDVLAGDYPANGKPTYKVDLK